MVYFDLEPVSEQNVIVNLQPVLERLPVWRREYALSYRRAIDRYLCGKSYLMLTRLLLNHFGLAGNPVFAYGKFGKPYLVEYPDIHFNISHCETGIICAVSDIPIGTDIERIQFDEDLAKHVLSVPEYSEVMSSGSPEVRFTEYWTMKESLLKLKGTGLTDNIKDILSGKMTDFRIVRDLQSEFVACIACDGNNVMSPEFNYFR